MESSEISVTITVSEDGKVRLFVADDLDITLQDLLFLLEVAKTQVLASYYEKIKS